MSRKGLIDSTPIRVVKKVHGSVDKERGVTGLPPEWKRLLRQSGISDQDLEGKDAATILKCLQYHTAYTQQKTQTKPPPTTNNNSNSTNKHRFASRPAPPSKPLPVAPMKNKPGIPNKPNRPPPRAQWSHSHSNTNGATNSPKRSSKSLGSIQRNKAANTNIKTIRANRPAPQIAPTATGNEVRPVTSLDQPQVDNSITKQKSMEDIEPVLLPDSPVVSARSSAPQRPNPPQNGFKSQPVTNSNSNKPPQRTPQRPQRSNNNIQQKKIPPKPQYAPPKLNQRLPAKPVMNQVNVNRNGMGVGYTQQYNQPSYNQYAPQANNYYQQQIYRQQQQYANQQRLMYQKQMKFQQEEERRKRAYLEQNAKQLEQQRARMKNKQAQPSRNNTNYNSMPQQQPTKKDPISHLDAFDLEELESLTAEAIAQTKPLPSSANNQPKKPPAIPRKPTIPPKPTKIPPKPTTAPTKALPKPASQQDTRPQKPSNIPPKPTKIPPKPTKTPERPSNSPPPSSSSDDEFWNEGDGEFIPEETGLMPQTLRNLDVIDLVSTESPKKRFKNFQKIGEGATGAVYLCTDRKHKKKVAVKKITIGRQKGKNDLDTLISEIIVLRECNHPSVVNYIDSFLVTNSLWVEMEFVDGCDLTDIVEICSPMREKHIACILKQVLEGLAHLHAKGIIHRDIKSDNVMLRNDGKAKITDLGFAAQLTKDKNKRKTVIGTPYWMAPEVIKEEDNYGTKIDIWSTGVMCMEMIDGVPPYMDLPPLKALITITSKGLPPPKNSDIMSEQFKDFIKQCTIMDAATRPTASRLLQHPFIEKSCKLADLESLVDRGRKQNAMSTMFF